MRSNISDLRNRIRANIAQNGTTILAQWLDMQGGVADAGTGTMVGAVETYLSGVFKAFVHTEPARSVVRTYQTIQTGDKILDIDPDAMITLCDGSGTVSLDEVEHTGLRFQMSDGWFVQADVGEELASIWDVEFAGVKLQRTIVLRKAS